MVLFGRLNDRRIVVVLFDADQDTILTVDVKHANANDLRENIYSRVSSVHLEKAENAAIFAGWALTSDHGDTKFRNRAEFQAYCRSKNVDSWNHGIELRFVDHNWVVMQETSDSKFQLVQAQKDADPLDLLAKEIAQSISARIQVP